MSKLRKCSPPIRDGLRLPCTGNTIAATFQPRSWCRCWARNVIMSENGAPVPNPWTHTTHGLGPSSCSSSHADAVWFLSKASQRCAPGSSGRAW